MVTIRLNTWVDAPVERCFRLATSVDFHIASIRPMKEKVVGGVAAGLLRQGQTVTLRGRHFGIPLTHTTKMEICRPFSYFREVMVSGVFKYYEHDHHFAAMDDGTRVRDEVRFCAPLGRLGRIAEKLVLKRYVIQLLKWRNTALKRAAESEEWHTYIVESGTEVMRMKGGPAKLRTLERRVQG